MKKFPLIVLCVFLFVLPAFSAGFSLFNPNPVKTTNFTRPDESETVSQPVEETDVVRTETPKRFEEPDETEIIVEQDIDYDYVSETSISDLTPAKPKRVQKGNFNLGFGLGLDIHNGKYKDKDGKEIKIKSSFVNLKVDMTYKIKPRLFAYADFSIGFPKKLDYDGQTHDDGGRWIDGTSLTNFSVTGSRYTAVNAGVVYLFEVDDFDVLVGGGLHFDSLYWDDEYIDRRSGTAVKKTHEYSFNSFGLNFRAEALYELNDYWLAKVQLSPSFTFSNTFNDEYTEKPGSGSYKHDATSGKINCDVALSLGAMYKF